MHVLKKILVLRKRGSFVIKHAFLNHSVAIFLNPLESVLNYLSLV